MPTLTPTPAPAADDRPANRDELTPGHLELGEGGFAGSRAWRIMVAIILGVGLTLFGAAFAINMYVDPAGISGAGVYRVQIVEGSLRSLKAGLLRAASPRPQVIIYGSSTSRNASPATVTKLTGEPTFNAGMSAGKPIDMYAMERYERSLPGPTAHAVYLVDVDQTFLDTPPNPGIRTTPQLWAQFTRNEKLRIMPAIFRPYFGLDMLRLSLLHAHRAGPGDANDPRTSPAAALRLFTADGYRKHDPYGIAQTASRARIEGTSYIDAIYRTGKFRQLGSQGTYYVSRFVASQHAAGDKPVLVLLPPLPSYRAEANSYGYEARRKLVLDWLRKIDNVTVVDATDLNSFGGTAAQFEDNVHMSQVNMDKLLGYLNTLGLLKP